MSESQYALDRPFFIRQGSRGILALHDLPGSPAQLLPLCETLAENGYTVSAPALPGPDADWETLHLAVRQAQVRLAAECESIVLLGLGAGSWLALLLAAEYMPAGAICLAPVFPPRPFLPVFCRRSHRKTLQTLVRSAMSSLYAVSSPILLLCREAQTSHCERILSCVSSREHSLCTLPYDSQLRPAGADRVHLTHQVLSFLEARI